MTKTGQGLLKRLAGLWEALGPSMADPLAGEVLLIRADASLEPKVQAQLRLEFMGGEGGDGAGPYAVNGDGIAEIPVQGVLSKWPSLFRVLGCSDAMTLPELSQSVRMAAADPAVAGIMLRIESPGGTAAGTPELAAEVAAAKQSKPVHAYGEDDCCSAAYWVGSQADRLTTNQIAHVGSIGTAAVIQDTSRRGEMQGIRTHVVATGAYKGAGAPGAPITDAHLAEFQRRVNDINGHFKAAVGAGRGMTTEQVDALADGRVHVGAKAHALGLTDGVETYGQALANLVTATQSRAAQPLVVEPGIYPTPPASPEEPAMSEKKEPEVGAEELGLFRKMLAALRPEVQSEPEKVAAPPPGLTNEQIDQRIEQAVNARMQAQEVDRDLATLAGRVPPATLKDAETRALLLEAKAKSPERYAAALSLVAGQDASGLLAGPIASAADTAPGRTGLSINASDQVWLEQNGVPADKVAAIESKYGRLNRAASN